MPVLRKQILRSRVFHLDYSDVACILATAEYRRSRAIKLAFQKDFVPSDRETYPRAHEYLSSPAAPRFSNNQHVSLYAQCAEQRSLQARLSKASTPHPIPHSVPLTPLQLRIRRRRRNPQHRRMSSNSPNRANIPRALRPQQNRHQPSPENDSNLRRCLNITRTRCCASGCETCGNG